MTAKVELKVIERLEDTETNTFMFELQCLMTNRSIEVVDWQCRCGELQRTGVPCPHLIACAMTVPQKSYLEFFNKRWIKEATSDMTKEPTDNNVSTMGTKTAGVFKSFVTMYA